MFEPVERLSYAPAAPIRLSLTSSRTDLPVPATVTIGAYYATGSVTLTPMANLAGQYTATLAASYGSTSLSTTIAIGPGLASVQIPPIGDEPNGGTFNVLFTGPAPAGGLTVKLSSDNSAITMPASYTFQAGAFGGRSRG